VFTDDDKKSRTTIYHSILNEDVLAVISQVRLELISSMECSMAAAFSTVPNYTSGTSDTYYSSPRVYPGFMEGGRQLKEGWGSQHAKHVLELGGLGAFLPIDINAKIL